MSLLSEFVIAAVAFASFALMIVLLSRTKNL